MLDDSEGEYPPGHPKAQVLGCMCDPIKNRCGVGSRLFPGAFFRVTTWIISKDCPIHRLSKEEV